ncbi:MAG: hypothetical protein DRP65_09855 [Planctomycetota bacterium]|nr:MAG: hypothetical protein DRP65_09855 [Planctomycetota bacterium]
MAGEYYSLEEVIEKLGKNEQQIKALVGKGKLHEFRDGTKVLFKIAEVDALVSEISQVDTAAGASGVELLPDDSGADTEPEAGLTAGINLGDLTGADTTVGTTGINVLGDTDDEYKLADDSQAETKIVESEGSEDLGSLDGDLSMDSVGSGSGLLDLSLQADDTSLGAVLDDILPAAGEGAAVAAVAEEADKIFDEAEPEAVEPIEPEPVMAPQYIKPQVDKASNSFGIVLFVSLLVMVYAAIVLLAGSRGIVPTIFKSIQGIIWYILIGIAVVVLGIVGFAALLGGKKKKAPSPLLYQQPTESS